jgi:hypothetical protein
VGGARGTVGARPQHWPEQPPPTPRPRLRPRRTPERRKTPPLHPRDPKTPPPKQPHAKRGLINAAWKRGSSRAERPKREEELIKHGQTPLAWSPFLTSKSDQKITNNGQTPLAWSILVARGPFAVFPFFNYSDLLEKF